MKPSAKTRRTGRRISRRLPDTSAPPTASIEDMMLVSPLLSGNKAGLHDSGTLGRASTNAAGLGEPRPEAVSSGSGSDSAAYDQPGTRRTGRRISRRLPVMSGPAITVSDDLSVTFPHPQGSKARVYNVASLDLPYEIARLLAHAARHHPEPLAHDTQQNIWYSICSFARFVHEDGQVASLENFDSAMVGRYATWLEHQTDSRTGAPWGQVTRGKKLGDFRRLVRTIKALNPDLLPTQIIFPTYCCPDREPPRTPLRLNKAELRSLMWCCCHEIREIRRRFSHRSECPRRRRIRTLRTRSARCSQNRSATSTDWIPYPGSDN